MAIPIATHPRSETECRSYCRMDWPTFPQARKDPGVLQTPIRQSNRIRHRSRQTVNHPLSFHIHCGALSAHFFRTPPSFQHNF